MIDILFLCVIICSVVREHGKEREEDKGMKRIKLLIAACCMMVCMMMLPQQTNAATVPQVKGLKAGSSSTREVNFHWKSISGATGYEIWRCSSLDGNFHWLFTVKAGTAFKNTTVEPGREYFYKVRAYKKNANGTKVYGKFSKILRMNTKMARARTVTAKYNINVRQYAGTNHKVLIGLKKGSKMSMLCATLDKNKVVWYRVTFRCNGRKYTGYVRNDIVK